MVKPLSGLDAFEPEWAATAVHEIGHAIAHQQTGLSVRRVRIWRTWLFGNIRGCTDIDESWLPDEQLPGYLVACMAGPEAETYWRSLTGHRGKTVSHGDEANFRRSGKGIELSQRQARGLARRLVVAQWDRVEVLATRLATSGTLRGGAL
ncbi:hypothetical protein [Saccharopolyspora spinosa]|uniref:Uncharacterized protein n=1 Tax=Saccharopolyspora spinosa TaxID=60894 RepID=A0A2N3XTY9_SACSN|nr:hypothetical protein [Saccharopolyspora spinosa]PKW14156.1 hypothetical protein A8926_1751 [Saccharopolyspora spinosa]